MGITITKEINEVLAGKGESARRKILDDAWKACCDGEWLATIGVDQGVDPWEKDGEEARKIELEAVESALEDWESELALNEIDLETFLFGGRHWIDGNPYREIQVEGFHCIYKKDEYPESFVSFENFRETAIDLIELYGWDEENSQAVDYFEATQNFNKGDLDELDLEKIYNEIMAEEE